MSIYRGKSLYTGWTWVCIQGDYESVYWWAWVYIQVSISLYTGWTWVYTWVEHDSLYGLNMSIYRMNMSLYRWWTCVYIYGPRESTGWTWVYIRGEHKHINWVNKSLYIQSEHESIYLYTGWTWVYIQSERGWSLFPCKVSVFKSWVSNLFKAEIYTLYCGLVCGPHVGKKAICYT